jgi:hypothetical protein
MGGLSCVLCLVMVYDYMLVSTSVMVAFRVIRAQGSGFGAQDPWVGLWFVGSWYNEGAGVRTTDLGYNRF